VKPGSYFAWCLTWCDHEEDATELRPFDTVTASPWPTDRRGLINVSYLDLGSAEVAAERYADYVHSHRDGWEATWPLVMRVRCPDGSVVDVEVERESVPEFTGRVVQTLTPEQWAKR